MQREDDDDEPADLGDLARRLELARNGKVPGQTSIYDLSGRTRNFMQGTHPFAR